MKQESPFLSPEQLAKRWGVSRKTLANHRSRKSGLPYHKIGNLVRYRLDDVEAKESSSLVPMSGAAATAIG